jgi:hypothetical protein
VLRIGCVRRFSRAYWKSAIVRAGYYYASVVVVAAVARFHNGYKCILRYDYQKGDNLPRICDVMFLSVLTFAGHFVHHRAVP